MTGLDLYAILTGWSSADAEPPAKEHVTSMVACRCGRRLALVVGSHCWVAADRLPRAGAADVVLDAAFLDFEALAAAEDATALDVVAFVRAANPGGGMDALARVLPPLRLPARWYNIAGLPDVADPARLSLGTSCRQCGTAYQFAALLVDADHTVIPTEADWKASIRGFEWPDAARGSRVSLYRHLTDVLLA